MIDKILKKFGYVKASTVETVSQNSQDNCELSINNPYKINYLSPHQMLTILGFNIPEEGKLVNPADFELIVGVLKLLGHTINPDHVTDEQLLNLRHSWHDDVDQRFPTLIHRYSRRELETDSASKMRGFMQAILTSFYKFQTQ
jgi:hypothetical protein